MAMVDTSGAGDEPPDKHFSFGRCIFHYHIAKKKNRKSRPHTEADQLEHKKRSGSQLLACFKSRTLDDDRTQEVQGRTTEDERTHESSLPMEGREDRNELHGMGSAGLMTGRLDANGSSSVADPSWTTVTLHGGIPARLYNRIKFTEALYHGETSTQDAPNDTSSLQAMQHGEGRQAQALQPISSPLQSTQIQSSSTVSASISVDHGRSFTQA